MILEEILQGESKKLELKEKLPESKKYIKTIIAFANTAGGKLIIGVSDESKELVGIPEDIIFSVKDKIADTITNMCEPQIVPNIYIAPVQDKNIIVVEVFPAPNRPYYIKSDGKENGTYIRISGSSRLADYEVIKDLDFQGSRLGFDETVCLECEISDEKIEKLCKDIKSHFGRDVKKKDLVNMKVLKEYGDEVLPTNAFALLTSDYFEYAYVQCARFKGISRAIFIDRKEYTGSIYEQVENAFAFVKNHINLGAEISGLYRKDNYELPIASIREMIINAVVHRNYVLNNSAIQVAVYDDRVEVTSPGMLVGQLDINMIKEGRSEIRNQTIARVFKKMNLIERWGTGVNRIICECEEYGLPEPKFEEIGNAFRVIMYRKYKANEAVNEAVNESVNKYEVVSGDETVILEKLKVDNKESRKKLSEQTGFSNSKVYRILTSLKEKAIIERVGSDKKGYWKIK